MNANNSGKGNHQILSPFFTGGPMFKHLFVTALSLGLVVSVSSNAAGTRFKGHSFESYIVSDNGNRFPEINKNGAPWLQVPEDAAYSIVVNNPLPVRVAVAVTIDGLNTIDGKRTTPQKAQKWIIEANSSLTLRGWQTDQSSLRRFIFTNQDKSYAEWKGTRDRKDYTRNLGVIGIAYFWNREELEEALHPPRPFAGRMVDEYSRDKAAGAPSSARSESESSPAKSKAGTGMGNRESNSVYSVEFNYDTGMYKNNQVLAIYYEFASNPPRPQPFIEEEYSRNFSPEMR